MKYNELNIDAARRPKRVGRGIAAGQGKTAGRGTKGQKARTGSSRKPGFEGGQNPLMQRLPKLRGFRSVAKPVYEVTTGQLNEVSSKTIDNAALAEAKLVPNAFVKVKLIVKGELKSAKDVKLQAASAGAVAALKDAKGSFDKVAQQPRPKKQAAK